MIRPLTEHEVLIFVVQFVLLLGTARILGELAKRINLPSVFGELLAGILLGPSLLGLIFPSLYHSLFPANPTQVHLLEILGFLGMIFLLLKSGFETDIKILKGLGRSVFLASAFGMVIPFIFGFVLAFFLPENFLVEPQRRTLFATFLGTLMAISAIPVLAKILMDLDVLRRNIGAMILGSGVMQDLVGYTLFSFVIAVAVGSGNIAKLTISIALGLLFILFLATIGYRLIFRLVKWVDDQAISEGSHITLIVVITFLLASITHLLHLHAVFGALLAGIILAGARRMRPAALEHIETMTDSIFAPVFFAYVGLRVDLFSLDHWGVFIIILVIAVVSKILGSLIGGYVGKLSFWESLALGIGTTARGSMEMIAALIGLSVGLLNTEMYGIIVLMALLTSLMAPPLLRLVLPHIHLTEDEKERLKAEKDLEKVIFKKKHLRILIPTGGGPNARKAIELAVPLGYYEDTSITTLFVQPKKHRLLLDLFFHPQQLEAPIASHHELAKRLGQAFKVKIESKSLTVEKDFSEGVIKEVEKGYDLVFLGASGYRRILQSQALSQIVAHSSAHLVVVKSKDNKSRYRRLLVPSRGDYYSKLATEFALLYAEAIEAEVTLFHVVKTGRGLLGTKGEKTDPHHLQSEVQSFLTNPDRVKIHTQIVEGESASKEILKELYHENYDLLVLGAENRSVTPDLNLGYGAENLIEEAPCSVVTLIPRAKKPKV